MTETATSDGDIQGKNFSCKNADSFHPEAGLLKELEKTPRHAQGDIKSNFSPLSATFDSNVSLQTDTSIAFSGTTNGDDAAATLQRCSRAAAERRRIFDSILHSTYQTSPPNPQSSLASIGATPETVESGVRSISSFGFHTIGNSHGTELPPAMHSSSSKHRAHRPSFVKHNKTFDKRQKSPKKSFRDPEQCFKSSGKFFKGTDKSFKNKKKLTYPFQKEHLPHKKSKPVKTAAIQRKNENYSSRLADYRSLLSELNGIENLVCSGTLDFEPTFIRRLLQQEIKRFDNHYSMKASLAKKGFFKAGNGSSAFETVGQAPTRVPAALVNSNRSFVHEKSPDYSKFASTIKEKSHTNEDDSEVCNRGFEVELEKEDEGLEEHETSTKVVTTKRKKDKKLHSSNLKPIFEANEILTLKVVFADGLPEDLKKTRCTDKNLNYKSAKVFIPEIEGYSFVGRILGPRGMSIRRLESETKCKIFIRGRGSVRSKIREEVLRNEGFNHLNEKLHTLIFCYGRDVEQCRQRVAAAVGTVSQLLTPQYDEYKRQQLMQLALINGTYRP